VGEGEGAGDVTAGIYVLYAGTELRVDRYALSLIVFHPRGLEVKPLDVGGAPDGNQHLVRGKHTVARRAARGKHLLRAFALYVQHLGTGVNLYPLGLEYLFEFVGQLLFFLRQYLFELFYYKHPGAEAVEDLGEFHTYGAGAEDGYGLREVV
jgi:hypothetical protein